MSSVDLNIRNGLLGIETDLIRRSLRNRGLSYLSTDYVVLVCFCNNLVPGEASPLGSITSAPDYYLIEDTDIIENSLSGEAGHVGFEMAVTGETLGLTVRAYVIANNQLGSIGHNYCRRQPKAGAVPQPTSIVTDCL